MKQANSLNLGMSPNVIGNKFGIGPQILLSKREVLAPFKGSCAHCVVREGAPYGRIEASKIPLLPIESYYHVTNYPFFSAC